MKKNVDIEIKLAPIEVAKCIFDMDAEEQAELLRILAHPRNYGKFCLQLQFVRDEIKENYGRFDKVRIAEMIDRFSEYFCEEMEGDQE